MPRLPRVTAAQTICVLEQTGFSLSRSSGSHFIYVNEQGQRTTVPSHAGQILHPKVLKNIIREAGLTVEEFINLLSE